MKLLIPITTIIAAASAGQIYNTAPQQEAYANSAEIYQSQLEYQQHGLYNDQSQAYTGHTSHAAANERPYGERTAKIVNFESESNGHGYKYAFETENGIKAQEAGQAHKGTEAHGAFSYKGDDGQTYTVTYTADEHGFRPQGAHLPTPPPIPEAIAKAIEQNEKDEAAGIYDDGKYVEQHHEAEAHQGEDVIYQAQLQAQTHHAQLQAQSHQAQIHQPSIHQAAAHQPSIHQASVQSSVHQASIQQPQYQSQHQIHSFQPSQVASVHQAQPQIHHHQQSAHHQPAVYQVTSPSFHHFEPSAFQHEAISGHMLHENSFHKH